MQRLAVSEIMKRAMTQISVTPPTTLVNSTSDDLADQIRSSLYRAASLVISAHAWQALRHDGAISSTNVDTQCDITVAYPDFNRMVPNTLWNASIGRQLIGPTSSEQWQAAKSTGVGPFSYQWRIQNDQFQILNQRTAGQSITFEYVSNYWLKKANEADRYDTIKAMTDICLLDASVMIAGLQWCYLESKGLDYAEKMSDFGRLLATAIATDKGAPPMLDLTPSHQGGGLDFSNQDLYVTGY